MVVSHHNKSLLSFLSVSFSLFSFLSMYIYCIFSYSLFFQMPSLFSPQQVKSTFGSWRENMNASDVIQRKKMNAIQTSYQSQNSSSNINSSSSQTCCPRMIHPPGPKALRPPNGYDINTNDLNSNLISTLDLSHVRVIQSNTSIDNPTSINPYTLFYIYYTIDPDGKLFGKTACGYNHYQAYLEYDRFSCKNN